MNIRTAELLLELEAILKANTLLNIVVVADKALALAEETNKVAVYANLTNTVPKVTRSSVGMDGYDFHSFFLLTINVDCTNDAMLIYDVVDSISRSLLSDSALWDKLVDRDILSIEYDNAEFSPKRSAILALDAMYRMTCT